MTRILFVGDLAGTGFGTVTMDLGRALLDLGEDVRFVSMNEGTDALPEPFASRTAIVGAPSGWLGLEDPTLTTERLTGAFTGGIFEDGWTPEAAILLGDPAAFQQSPILGYIPDGFLAYHYVPIEGVGIPPRWKEIWRKAQPVAMCEFGADQIAGLGLSRPPIVPHGVDTSVFHAPSAQRPLTFRTDTKLEVARSRADARKILGWPKDDVILFRSDRLMPRKAYASLLRSVAPVLARHANARLVIHCATRDQGGDLRDLISHFPAQVGNKIHSTGFHDRYGGVPREILALMYAAADLYVTTAAEGFGLCIAESLACGTPVVGLDFSSVPEVIGPCGVVVPVGALVDNVYGYFWAQPNEKAFATAVDELVTDIARRQVLGAKGPYHVREHFTWPRGAELFATLIRSALPMEVAA